jgi:hypothetical protein
MSQTVVFRGMQVVADPSAPAVTGKRERKTVERLTLATAEKAEFKILPGKASQRNCNSKAPAEGASTRCRILFTLSLLTQGDKLGDIKNTHFLIGKLKTDGAWGWLSDQPCRWAI